MKALIAGRKSLWKYISLLNHMLIALLITFFIFIKSLVFLIEFLASYDFNPQEIINFLPKQKNQT
ncbi:MAG: hypothetical protein K6L75_08195 [Cellvibrionaceae bacterium]